MAIIKMTDAQYDRILDTANTKVKAEYESRLIKEPSMILQLLLSENGVFPTIGLLEKIPMKEQLEQFLPYLLFFAEVFIAPQYDPAFDDEEFQKSKKWIAGFLYDALEVCEAIIRLTDEQFETITVEAETSIRDEYENRHTKEPSLMLQLLTSENGAFPTTSLLEKIPMEEQLEKLLPYLLFFKEVYVPPKDDPAFDDDEFQNSRKWITNLLYNSIEIVEQEKVTRAKKPRVTRKKYEALKKQARWIENQRQNGYRTDDVSFKYPFYVANRMLDEEGLIDQLITQIDQSNVLQYLPMLIYYDCAYQPPKSKELKERYAKLKTNIKILLSMVEVVESPTTSDK